MLKNIALREQIIWYPCKIDLKSDSVEKLELLSIDEIKSSTFIRKKYINECIVYFNENKLSLLNEFHSSFHGKEK